MNCHVEDAEMELAKVEDSIVNVLRLDLEIDELVWDLLAGLKVLAQCLELFFCPTPVLEHLTWCFDEISDNAGTVEAGVLGACSKIMDSVA